MQHLIKYSDQNLIRVLQSAVRKQAYSNILKILPPKSGNFQIKILLFFIFLLENIDCGSLLGLPHCFTEAVLMSTVNLCFRAEIRKIMYTPVNPSFTI